MLLTIRDRARGWVAWVIVGLISIPFALWGLHSYFAGPDTRVIATVGGHEITSQDYTRAYRNQVEQLREAYGEDFPAELLDDENFQRAVVEGLVTETLLRQFIEDRGFSVGDAHLAQSIQQIEAFRVNGSFSADRYDQLTRVQYGSTAAFEQEMRRSIMHQQLRGGIGDSTLVTDRDIDMLIRVYEQERQVSHALLPVAHFRAGLEVSDEEVQAFYEDNHDRFRTGERVRLAYLMLDPEEIADGVQVTEQDLREMYEAEINRFTAAEERRARHILLSLEERDETQARELAQSLYERLQAGESFRALAEEYSDDSLSAADGGSLGWVARDDMVTAFEQTLFALEKGEFSEPVRTRFGFHLVQLDDVRGGEVTPFAEVRDELEERYQRDRVEGRFFDLAERLADLTFDHGGSLEPAAEELGLEIRETGWFTREGGDGIARHSSVVREAFDPEVLEEGLNSRPVELADDRVVVVRVAEHEPASVRPLEEVRAQVEDELRAEKARQLAYERGQELLAEVREGATEWDALSGLAEVTLAGPQSVSRDSDALPREVLQEVFRLPRPREEGVSLGWSERADGSFVLLRLESVTDGDAEAWSAEDRRMLGQQLARERADAEMGAFVQALRAQTDVNMYLDRL